VPRQSIRRVYEAELQAIGELAERIEVAVTEDKIHGSLAEISIKAAPGVSADEIKQKGEDILARYTVAYRLKIQPT